MLPWGPIQTPGRENCDGLSWMPTDGKGSHVYPETVKFPSHAASVSTTHKSVGGAEPAPPTPQLFAPEQGPAGEGEAAGVV